MKASKIFAVLSIIVCVISIILLVLTFAAQSNLIDFYRNVSCNFTISDESILYGTRKAAIIAGGISLLIAIISLIVLKAYSKDEVAVPELQPVVVKAPVQTTEKKKVEQTTDIKAVEKKRNKKQVKKATETVVETAKPFVMPHTQTLQEYLNSKK